MVGVEAPRPFCSVAGEEPVLAWEEGSVGGGGCGRTEEGGECSRW